MITINHHDNNKSNHIKSFITRVDTNFICDVYWPKDTQTDFRKIKFENGIKQYIETKSEFLEYDYKVYWGKVLFYVSINFLDRFPSLILKANKKMNVFAKKVETC